MFQELILTWARLIVDTNNKLRETTKDLLKAIGQKIKMNSKIETLSLDTIELSFKKV
jgi:hypothetical protein